MTDIEAPENVLEETHTSRKVAAPHVQLFISSRDFKVMGAAYTDNGESWQPTEEANKALLILLHEVRNVVSSHLLALQISVERVE